ncbi:hypothetical protein Moror_13143 [Moniliophthora roreri MCA 2997]|uniref:Uncharacterized protein n=1 Tax=Moniliophthora roreri (strain MCA 2997) TaxID=1381753 RepID=V2YBB2_MONRO|nr:hypothetical protein Moror_13143 [Moniliophthora roreri MCA 2997]
MLFLISRILVTAALAKAIQAQGTFSGIPDRIRTGSDLNVVFSYSGSGEIHAVTLGIFPAGGLARRRIIRESTSTVTSREGRTLLVPVVAGTYCVQAIYFDSNGDNRRDLSSPFVAFDAEGEGPVDPFTTSSPTATPSSTTPESSNRSLPGSIGSETNNAAAQSTSEPSTAVTEQTTSRSSASITADPESTLGGARTSAGITTDINSTSNGTTTGSIISTGTTSAGQPTTSGASSTDPRQPTIYTSSSSAAPSNAVSPRNNKSNSKAGIIAGSVIGATLVLLAFIIAIHRRYKKLQGDGLSVQPFILQSPIEKQPRKGIEESGQEEDEDDTREARIESAPHTRADRARQSIFIVHEDSGWRPDQTRTPGDVRVVDLPPDYDAAQ